MGADKAFLQLGGRSLIQHATDLARTVTSDVRIVGDPLKFAACGAVLPDVYAGHGPLAGIHAALRSTETDCNLILGVDLPFVEPEFLTYLCDMAQSAACVVTIPRIGARLQTLCAVYRKAFAVPAEGALLQNRNRIDALFPGLPIRIIEEEEIVQAGFVPSMFRNLNTPEEWHQAQQDYERAQHL